MFVVFIQAEEALMQMFALIQGGYDIIIYKVLYFMHMSMKQRHCIN